MTDFSDAFIKKEGEQRKYFSGKADDEDVQGLFTSCEDCVFSGYEKDTQTSCKLNRVDKFKDKGVEIMEAYNDAPIREPRGRGALPRESVLR